MGFFIIESAGYGVVGGWLVVMSCILGAPHLHHIMRTRGLRITVRYIPHTWSVSVLGGFFVMHGLGISMSLGVCDVFAGSFGLAVGVL